MSEIVYLNYTAEELGELYDNRKLVPEYPYITADWEARSESYRNSAHEAVLDIPFGPSEVEKLDLFLPDVENPPLHVFIHGGYWQWNYKEPYSFLSKSFNEAGIACAIMNYALCPDVSMLELIRQVRASIAFLWREAASYGYDAERMQVSGNSAGGHLTAMMAATDWPAFEKGLPAQLIKSVIAISGLYDLEPFRHFFIGDPLKLSPSDVAWMSPIHLTCQPSVQTILTYGGDESSEFKRQAETLGAIWQQQEVDLEVLEIPDKNHFTILAELAEPEGALFTLATKLLLS